MNNKFKNNIFYTFKISLIILFGVIVLLSISTLQRKDSYKEVNTSDSSNTSVTYDDVFLGPYSSSTLTTTDSDGQHIYRWGENVKNALGVWIPPSDSKNEDPFKSEYRSPEEITIEGYKPKENEKITFSSLGESFSLVGTNDGNIDHLYSVGADDSGQLGNGFEGNQDSFVEITKDDYKLEINQTIKFVSTGLDFSLVVVNDGEIDHIYTWGDNRVGQLGLGDNKDRWVPTELTTGEYSLSNKDEVTNVSIGMTDSVAVTINDGTKDHIYTWGDNSHGKLGLGTDEEKNYNTPQELTKDAYDLGDQKVTKLFMSKSTSAALINDGTKDQIYTWGWGDQGQLGFGGKYDYFSPKKLTDGDFALKDNQVITNFSIGTATSMAVMNDGTKDHLYMWGSNTIGEFGIGKDGPPKQFTPKEFITLEDGTTIKQISLGRVVSSIITTDSNSKYHLYSTGSNYNGETGTGSDEDILYDWTEVKVPPFSPFIEEPTNIIKTDDGETFDIIIDDGEGAGAITDLSTIETTKGDVSTSTGKIEAGENNVTLKNVTHGDSATITITLKSGMEDVVKDIVVDVDKLTSIGDAEDLTETSDGATFNVDIEDGKFDGAMKDGDLSIDNGDVEVSGGTIGVGTNAITVTNLNQGDSAIVTIVVHSNLEDVSKDFNIQLSEDGSIGDAKDISKTDDGETFSTNIVDGSGDERKATDLNLDINHGTVIANGGTGLKIGKNDIVVSGLNPGNSAVVTIKLISNISTITKDFNIEVNKTAVIKDPQNIVYNSDGEEFDLDIEDGKFEGEIQKLDLSIDNGKVDANDGDGLSIGRNHIIVSGLSYGEDAVLTITLKSDLEPVTKDIDIQLIKVAHISDPSNFVTTKHGATFNLSIVNGEDKEAIDSYEIIIDSKNSKVSVTVNDGDKLNYNGDNSFVVDGLKHGQSAKITILLISKSGMEVSKDIDVKVSNLTFIIIITSIALLILMALMVLGLIIFKRKKVENYQVEHRSETMRKMF